MKKKIVLLFVFALSVMLIFAFTSCNDESSDEWKNDMYLKLVNKSNSVDASYIPDNLVYIDKEYTTGGKTLQLEKSTCEALTKMLDAMRSDGIINVSVTSAYRTYEYQSMLFTRYFNQEKNNHPNWSDDEIRAEVLTYSAAPGTSEHQTGLCVDLFTTEMEGLWNYGSETPNNPYDKGFAETAAFSWLTEHAHEYGFVLRFPENKTVITGYSYESWHYRYVGVEHATKIYDKGITLEEYLESNGK